MTEPNITKKKLSSFRQQDRNANRHTNRGKAALAIALHEDGIAAPITTAADGEVIDGSLRLALEQEIYKDGEAIVLEHDGTRPIILQRTDIPSAKTPAARRIAYRANRIAEIDLNWDARIIEEDYREGAIDMIAIFGAGDLRRLLDLDLITDAGPQLEKANELNQKWGVQTGDIFRAGNHIIACADCTDPSNWAALLGKNKANLLVTSPPYWVGKEYERQESEAEIDAFILACVESVTPFVNRNNGRIVINTGFASIHKVESRRSIELLFIVDKWVNFFREQGWLMRHCRIWAKSGGLGAHRTAPAADMIDTHHEHIITFSHETDETDEFSYIMAFWNPAGTQRGQTRAAAEWAQQGIWQVAGDRSGGGYHIAAFPLEIPERVIRIYSEEDEIVLEPFAGSGTTIIACENWQRRCVATELKPEYVAASLERIAASVPGIKIEKIGQLELESDSNRD